ncbi:MAG TPA: hypothetical protein VNJ07_00040 [Chitinophagales bacterium]|nr:hypothetical protein [Chitinophagales bacterium]
MTKKKILFTIGSPNQTTQMHQISMHLPDYDCFFSQHYGKHPWVELGQHIKILDNTIIGVKSHWKKKADAYLAAHGLRNDYRAEVYGNKYDMAVMCIDYTVPKMFRKIKSIFIQEGMIDPLRTLGKIVKFFRMPGYWAFDTSLMGYSNKPDLYCVASEGYRQHYIKMGVTPEKIIVTGIPNFDNAESFRHNDFPHKGYVMVATSDIREAFRNEDRIGFIKKCVEIAAGRPMLFKLHPNENKERAEREIREHAPPGTLIFHEGNTNHMIANCDELICQYSTVVYIGMALGKKVHSFFDLDYLKKMMPLQNGGKSAERIAQVIKGYMEFDGSGMEFLKQYQPPWLEHPHHHTSPQRLVTAA